MDLTHTVYVLLSIVYGAVLLFMIVNNLRMDARIKELERRGFHPTGPDEAIVAAKRMQGEAIGSR